MFELGNQMKPIWTVQDDSNLESHAELSEYCAKTLLQDKSTLAFIDFPLPLVKATIKELAGETKKEEVQFNFTSHLPDVVEIVHGSTANKAKLTQEIRQKIPALSKKPGIVQNFLSECVNRGKSEGNSKVR